MDSPVEIWDNARMRGKNVTIAGAGPAGMAAAIYLARSGYQVKVYDARSSPGVRFAGGFQVLDNYSLNTDVREQISTLHLHDHIPHHPLKTAVLFDPRGYPHSVQSSEPYGFLITRRAKGSLDDILFRTSRELGVRFFFGSRVSRADIMATGPHQPDGISREWHFSTDDNTRIRVYFNPDTSPGGYSYLFTFQGEGTFGTAITRHFASLPDFFERNLKFFRALEDLPMRNIRVGHSYMNFFLRNSAVLSGALLAGEAAGFQDFLFGLGLRQALLTGQLAAKSLVTGASYDRLWKPAIHNMARISVVNRFLYEFMGKRGMIHFASRASGVDFRVYLQRWIRGTFSHRLLFPVVTLLWKNRKACTHLNVRHWCRRR